MARNARSAVTSRPVRAESGSGAHRAPDPLTTLAQLRAAAELQDIKTQEALLRGEEAGHSQRLMAESLGIPQTAVHRILQRARVRRREQGRTDIGDAEAARVRLALLEFAAGNRSWGLTVGALGDEGALAGGHSPEGNQIDGYVPGAWDAVRTAYLDKLITEKQYDQLRELKRTNSKVATESAS